MTAILITEFTHRALTSDLRVGKPCYCPHWEGNGVAQEGSKSSQKADLSTGWPAPRLSDSCLLTPILGRTSSAVCFLHYRKETWPGINGVLCHTTVRGIPHHAGKREAREDKLTMDNCGFINHHLLAILPLFPFGMAICSLCHCMLEVCGLICFVFILQGVPVKIWAWVSEETVDF